MHLVVPAGGSFREPRRIELGPRVLTIGRAESADVRIDVPGVDDEHAKISELALVAVGPDCAVGDVPLDAGQRRLLAPGDEVQVGSVVLGLDGPDPSLGGAPDRTSPRIRVVEGQNFGDEMTLEKENREYIIGRSPKADLVLEDREVSREHLKIVRRGAQIFIYDQASTRGSWLGRQSVYQGSRIEWERARMLKVGATVLALDLPQAMSIPVARPSAPHTPPPIAKGSKPAPVLGPSDGVAPSNVVAYHYTAQSSAKVVDIAPSEPDLAPVSPRVSRGAWKKSGPRIGRASGLLLLALGGIAILAVIFGVFFLLE